jgi:polyisoprenoid-binding protein YceI
VLEVLLYSAATGGALVLGAVLGCFRTPPKQLTGGMLAFASGALVVAVAFELFEPAHRQAGLARASTALVVGAATFIGVDLLLPRRLCAHDARLTSDVVTNRAGGQPSRAATGGRRGSGMAAAPRMLEATPPGGDTMSNTLTEQKKAAVERWTADPSRTIVEFEVEHLWGLHTVHGRFTRFAGSYVRGPAGTAIELTIDAASVDTGNTARDRHLRSWDFFDVVPNPQVRFTSVDATETGDSHLRVRGELEAAGTSVPLELDAAVRTIGAELEIEATTTVDHRRFGMSEGPLANVRPPAKLHVKARLVPDGAA